MENCRVCVCICVIVMCSAWCVKHVTGSRYARGHCAHFLKKRRVRRSNLCCRGSSLLPRRHLLVTWHYNSCVSFWLRSNTGYSTPSLTSPTPFSLGYILRAVLLLYQVWGSLEQNLPRMHCALSDHFRYSWSRRDKILDGVNDFDCI